MTRSGERIDTWLAFRRRLRAAGLRPFAAHDRYPGAVFVGGCQRSGSTLMTHLVADTGAFVDLRTPHRTIELESALLLSGLESRPTSGRCVFQTTYLNADVNEYGRLGPECRLIWMVRKPESVVYSMLYNWSRRALDNVFRDCGTALMTASDRRRHAWLGRRGVSRAKRACYAYAGKAAQVATLVPVFGASRLLIVDYDRLVDRPAEILPDICRFVGAPFDERLTKPVHRTSLRKADELPARTRSLVAARCSAAHASTLRLLERLDAERRGQTG